VCRAEVGDAQLAALRHQQVLGLPGQAQRDIIEEKLV
jgi:hypothetical protein